MSVPGRLSYVPSFAPLLMVLSSWGKLASAYQITVEREKHLLQDSRNPSFPGSQSG